MVEMLLLLLVVVANIPNSTDGSGPTILVPKPCSGFRSGSREHHRSRRRRAGGGRRAGIDLLVDVGHFIPGAFRGFAVVPEGRSGPVPWPNWQGEWRF